MKQPLGGPQGGEKRVDTDELLKISDHILVMSAGLITYETPAKTADIADIGTSSQNARPVWHDSCITMAMHKILSNSKS